MPVVFFCTPERTVLRSPAASSFPFAIRRVANRGGMSHIFIAPIARPGPFALPRFNTTVYHIAQVVSFDTLYLDCMGANLGAAGPTGGGRLLSPRLASDSPLAWRGAVLPSSTAGPVSYSPGPTPLEASAAPHRTGAEPYSVEYPEVWNSRKFVKSSKRRTGPLNSSPIHRPTLS